MSRLIPNSNAEGGKQIQTRWLSLEQAGEYMGGRSAEAVRMLLRRGRLPYVQHGRRVLLDRLDIDRLMEQGKVSAARPFTPAS